MTVSQRDVVDWLGIEKDTGFVALTIVDDLDWSNEQNHLELLQEKVNRYVAFVESEEVFSKLKEHTGRSVRKGTPVKISVLAKYPIPPEGVRFVRHVESVLKEANIHLEHKVLSGEE